MKTPLQRIEDNEDESRARRTPRNRNSTPSIQPLQTVLPPDRHSLTPKSLLWAIFVDGACLHARFNGVGGEEEEVVRHAC